ncbi:MAG: phosphoglycerate kinase, partial [Rickettsiales bacterium]|nr:phosphoglycerate kinase [Rickettsiales bacterium]
MNIHTIEELPAVAGKYILLRDDFNVQIVDGVITDAFRIEQSLPTIRRLTAAGARVVIAAHLGRPEGVDPELSLRPVALTLEQLLGAPVLFVDDCLNRDFMPDMTNGGVAVLENLRFYPGEEKNDLDFSRKLAEGMDFYVNDAFAVSHRAHASVDAITGFLPSFAGELLAREVAELTRLTEAPARPLVGLISGSKVASKIGVIKALAKLCDRVIVSGVIGTTFRIMSGNAPAGLNLGGNVKDDINDPKI